MAPKARPLTFRAKTKEERRKHALIAGILIFVIGTFLIWYIEAAGVSENAAGFYRYQGRGTKVELSVSSDHLFHETIYQDGQIQRAAGTWHTFGEGHIGFSHEFITIANQEVCYGDQSCGWLESWFGFMTMDLGLNRPGLRFRKRLFSGIAVN